MDAYVAAAVRTVRGKGNPAGALAGVKPVHLLSRTLRSLQEKTGLDTSRVEEAFFGCVTQTGEQGGNIGKLALLAAGWSDRVPGVTLNRYCASALSAINLAATTVTARGGLAVAGGVESMSRVPIMSDKSPLSHDLQLILEARLVHIGICADLVATLRGYERAQLDEYACGSQARAAQARRERRASLLTIDKLDHDEPVRENTTLEKLASLQPAFAELGAKGADAYVRKFHPGLASVHHLHTAGNSPATADGASAVLVGSKDALKHLPVRARILATAEIAVDPVIGLTGAADAAKAVLARAGLDASKIDLYEVNESFAALMLDFMRELGIGLDRLNVNGGAIALGHPMGATGGVLVATLLDELERRKERYGLVAICGAAGLAAATLIERL